MEQNIAVMKSGTSLCAQERSAIQKISAILRQGEGINCTSCGYCTSVCPQNIKIPQALSALNILIKYHDLKKAQRAYLWVLPNKASLCTSCGACEKVCPQNISIIKNLAHAKQTLERADIERIESY
jgi:predicted aldo/keto reductase-like oxidoreductase